MSFFESLKQKHLGEKPLHYLWELKVTDSEYVELKQLLAKYAKSYSRNMSNRFITVCKECALMIAEYWRREYVDGYHSKEMVFKAIDPSIIDEYIIDEFYEAAKRGARSLKLELFEGDGGKRYLDSMLYQGGLPMKLVTGNVTNSVWDRFTRGLVNRKINFEELNLGIVASNNTCLKAYCDELRIGAESGKYMRMPFFCQNENDAWFIYLKELAKEERIRRHQQYPMKLYIEFKVDNVERLISTKYVFKGDQRLTQAFLDSQGLHNVNFFSVQVRKNGQAVDTFDYVNNFCRYTVVSKHPYVNGDNITIYLHNQEEPYLSDDLDMDVPRLLYREKDGIYVSGNHIGKDDSLLLIPDGWDIEDETSYNIQKYTWGERIFRGIPIPADFTNKITVKGADGAITFGTNAALYWTDIQTNPLYQPDIVESLYNADKCSFALCYDTDDGIGNKRCNVQFRNKWQSEWTTTPSYGEIFARAIDINGHYVTPIRFINIGEGLSISVIQADKDSCQIKVTWPHGLVSTNEGERKANDVWAIKKEDCSDPRKIHFLFTPNDNGRNQFTLSFKAPFKDFSIVNIYGDYIENDCWIPYSDVDKYQYHLVGQDIKELKYGNISRQIKWKGDKLVITENGQTLKRIPYEGSLITLFDSREELLSLLERTSQTMLNAEVKVMISLSEGKKMCFSIKKSPFRAKQTEDGRIEITGNNRKIVKFTGVLKLLPLSEPKHEAVEMSFDQENGCYYLPETIRPWGKTILIGRTRGRICPALVDLTREMNGEYRASNRETAIATISENLSHATMGDDFWKRVIGWFKRSQDDDIPASSILELYCTAQNYKSLLCLVFQLYYNSKVDERDTLKEKLKSFSNDLAFQWYWLQPHLSGLMHLLEDSMSDPMSSIMQTVYINWAMSKKAEDVMKYLSALNDQEAYMANIGQCFMEELTSFTNWMNDLCVSSLLDRYDNHSEDSIASVAECIIKNPKDLYTFQLEENNYVELNQESLGEEVESFFNNYSEPGRLGNEQWLYKRVNAVVAHLNKETDLFTQREEIRRSIIFCCKSSNHHFIIALNNKLSKSRL